MNSNKGCKEMYNALITKMKELPTSEKNGKKRDTTFQEKNGTLFIICLLNVLKKLSYNGFKPNYFTEFQQQINTYAIAI